MTTRASACGCSSTPSGMRSGMTGRLTREPVRNWWPAHDMTPRSDFISERNRTSLMWKL